MKYRRIPSKKRHESRGGLSRQIRRIDSDRRLTPYWYRGENIDLSSIFIENRLKKGNRASLFERLRCRFARASLVRKRIFGALSRKIRRAWAATLALSSKLFSFVRLKVKKWRSERKEPKDIAILSGALVGVMTVSLVLVGLTLYILLFSEFFGRYERVTVPDMVGMSYDEAASFLDGVSFEVTFDYEYSSSVEAGRVLSQKPDGGVERKIYSRGEPLDISITLSLGRELVELPEYVGKSARDASLELKNAAFSVTVVEVEDRTVPAGQVISTSPVAGSMVEVGSLVVLNVSRGEEKILLTVPDVCGLTEASAIAKIRAAGFVIGDVEYKSSKETVGVVITQDRRAKTKATKGGKISITVSAGQSYPEKTVPSLYGLTLSEAKALLAEYGLVVGNVYVADSYEPSGSVIAQSPSAGETISPSVVSVDMYVSK